MSGGPVLAHTLVVRHPETGEPVALLADHEVPAWAKGLVHEGNLVGQEPKAKPEQGGTRRSKAANKASA